LASTLNLEHLRTFALVLETGSFSAAAQRLDLTQPAISLQVRQLERRLAVRLIERVGKRATPTAAGSDLLGHLHHIEAAVSNAISAVASHTAGITGRVRLGTGATACLYFLPPILRALRQQFPALSVVVSTGNTDELVRKVEQNTLDLVLATLPVGGRTLQATPVLDDEFVAIARQDDPPLPARATPAALHALPMVLFEPGASTRQIIDGWFGAAGLTPSPVMELGSVETMKEMVAAGLGCAVLPRMAVTGRGLRDELVVRSLRPRLHRTLALVTRRDKPLTRGLQQVCQAITQAGRQQEHTWAHPAGASQRKLPQ
jgi:DNA-binding transcriptional LysR family regulator